MPETSQQFCYSAVLEPWARLAWTASDVMSLRLATLPYLWLNDPITASIETQRMFIEKQEAWQETVIALSLTPWHIWYDTINALWNSTLPVALATASANSSRRLARPSRRRVRANLQRLGSA